MMTIANPPNVILVSRSKHGFRVYWDSPKLHGCRFRPTLEGENLLLDQVDEDDLEGNIVRSTSGNLSEWQTHHLKGDWFKLEGVKIPAVPSGNGAAYVIPGVKGLAVSSGKNYKKPLWASRAMIEQQQREQRVEEEALPVPPVPPVPPPAENTSSVVATDQYLLRILDTIERVEQITFHRLVKDADGWAWRAPDIRRSKTPQ